MEVERQGGLVSHVNMPASILVINTGSSSLKFGLFAANSCECLARGIVDWVGDPDHAELRLTGLSRADMKQSVAVRTHGEAVGVALRAMIENSLMEVAPAAQIKAVGHRVVHGGTLFRDSVVIDERVRTAIAELATLAPLHNPPALEAIEAVETALPGVPQVAVFDTSFFTTLPPKAFVYPLPYEWFTDWGVRRFGFHGISHAYCARRAAELLGRELCERRLVICHLGNGCSASAISNGQPIATTMGFTPLDGLMMGTRPGSLDPGILLDVQQRHGLTAESLDHILNHQSGLLGVSGVSADVRQLEAAAQAGNDRARLALEMFADRVRATIGALAVTLGGVDALIFTAGVGENSANLRAAICNGLECLGLHLDHDRNSTASPDADIASQPSPSRILVVESREDVLIARETDCIVRHPDFLSQMWQPVDG